MANVFPLANGDVVTVTQWGTLLGSRVLNVLHFRVHGLTAPLADGESECIFLSDSLSTMPGSFNDLLRNLQVTQYTHDYNRVQKVYPVRYPYVHVDIGVSGSDAGDPESSNIDAVIVKRSARVGRGRSGDFHVAGIPKTATDGALLTNVYLPNLQAVANVMTEELPFNIGTGFWRPIVGVPTSDTEPETTMIDAVAQKEVRVMVKRTAFRGI